MRKLPALEWLYLGIAAVGYLVAAILHTRVADIAARSNISRVLAIVLFIACALTAVLQVWTASASVYLASLTMQAAATMALIPLVAGDLNSERLILAVLAAGACLHNPYPLNLVLSLALTMLFVVLRSVVLDFGHAPPDAIIGTSLDLAVTTALLSILASLLVHYRERLISEQRDSARLDGLVDRLTGANLRYQEYAISVEAASTEIERKRITRDIHDAVGYTLTTNITMMEAVTDMMRDNPLGVQYVVDAARQNAQEGLSRIREALRELRAKAVDSPRGAQAVRRLLVVFERATGVKVELVSPDMPWDFPDELDSAFYHVVQESLTNSFRHGKSTRVRVFLWRENGQVVLKVSDNGKGAGAFEEGIGLTGMRERLEKLGGSLRTQSQGAGFDVVATAPCAVK